MLYSDISEENRLCEVAADDDQRTQSNILGTVPAGPIGPKEVCQAVLSRLAT